MARRLARRAGAPLVFTHHTRFGDYRHYLGPLSAPGASLLDAYLQRFWRGCAAIVAPGSELATEISERLSRQRRAVVRTIPTGIEVTALAALPAIDPRPMAGWSADALVVTTLGRLAPEKSWRRSPTLPPTRLASGFRSWAAGRPRWRFGHGRHSRTWSGVSTSPASSRTPTPSRWRRGRTS
jgi:hypothetical protein